MPSYLDSKKDRFLLLVLIAITVGLLGAVAYYNWILAVVGLIVLILPFYFLYKWDAEQKKEVEKYISTLSYRIKTAGEEAFMGLPIGIMLYNDDYYIEWANPYLISSFREETLVGKSLHEVGEFLIPMIRQESESEVITFHDRTYKVTHRPKEHLMYFLDITEQTELEKLYEEEKTVIAIIYLDNYDELTQGMDDQARSNINSLVISILNDWAHKNGIYLKRFSSDRFVAVFNERILQTLEKNKFAILDDVREITAKKNLPLTLSIGVGTGVTSLPELGVLAQSSLDLVLGRGGDQVAIKHANGKVKFYGGKTNPVEKRTRVRARVISHALKELVTESSQVMIMGHKNPDMDAIGSAIGILKVAQINDRKGYVVINFQEMDKSAIRLMREIKKNEKLYSHFISPEEALEKCTRDTLLVIVDTHKPSMVIEEKLLKEVQHVVVIDHHRRGEDFIKNPLLVYMEPYASSTSELVTELLEYQPKRGNLDMLEATALLAGIIVDTKSFTLRTGSRTFDAASYLRANGADTVLVQKLLREDKETYVQRAKLVESSYIYKNGISIAKGRPDQILDHVLIAQTADILLTMNGIIASFVISKLSDETVGISARSLGEINVQLIMEKLNGGGHLTNAATQLRNVTVEKAEKMLQQAIDDYLEGRQGR